MMKRFATALLLLACLIAFLPQHAAAQAPGPASPASAVADAPREPALTRPGPVLADRIDSGDTAWLLTATALVMLMTLPGVALFYGGMVRRKNVLGTAAHSFAAACVATLAWVTFGYSLAFTPGSPYIGGLERLMLEGLGVSVPAGTVTIHPVAPTVPESVFLMFQMSFAIITPALVAGAVAERMKFSSLLLFVALWSVLVYAPVAHWVWEPGGWLASQGVLDFAGGTVVHINAGISGLVAALMLGPRAGYGREPMPPHNLVLTLTGACLLWVGWFGFNAGSAVAADGRAGSAMLVTQVAAAAGALSWMLLEWGKRAKPSVLGLVSGSIGGLVGITPAAGFVSVGAAVAIGACAGAAAYLGATSLKSMFGYDDSLDVFGVHAIAGIVGALLTGVFASKGIGGVDSTVATQLIGVVATLVYSGIMSAAILWLIKLLFGLRIAPQEEQEGVDLALHGEQLS